MFPNVNVIKCSELVPDKGLRWPRWHQFPSNLTIIRKIIRSGHIGFFILPLWKELWQKWRDKNVQKRTYDQIKKSSFTDTVSLPSSAACMHNCLVCDKATTCDKCIDGWYFDRGEEMCEGLLHDFSAQLADRMRCKTFEAKDMLQIKSEVKGCLSLWKPFTLKYLLGRNQLTASTLAAQRSEVKGPFHSESLSPLR